MKVVDFSVGTAVTRAGCGCICSTDENYSAGYGNGKRVNSCGGKCFSGNSANNHANYDQAYNKVH